MNYGNEEDTEEPGGEYMAPVTRSDAVFRPDGSTAEKTLTELEGGTALRPLYEAAGAVYNAGTGFYELNGLNDITEEQMRDIYVAGVWSPISGDDEDCQFKSSPAKGRIRTILPAYDTNRAINGTYMFAGGNTALEVIQMYITESNGVYFSQVYGMFSGCRALKKIVNPLYFNTNVTEVTRMFELCLALEDVKLMNLRHDISLSDSPNLSKDSILCMIQNSAATTDIAITLHPTAFAMAASDTDIQQALADHPLVSLAQNQ